MQPALKKRIQVVLAIAVVLAAVRTTWVLYERYEENIQQSQKKAPPPPLNPDYYVTPRKLYAYNLKSAREGLTKQPVWVKEGYRYTYYPYNAAGHHSDFGHQGGLLLPLQKLEIKDVILDTSPEQGRRQVMALFLRDGKNYAFPIGFESGGDYHIYSDEMLFIQDPKDLYQHWPADVWQAIEKHEVKPGMNELQADFAIGMGVPEVSYTADTKTVKYPNGGKPITITYQKGKAVEIKPGSPA